MPRRRVLYSSILLNNDRVLITGGNIDNIPTALYYRPTSSTWIETEPMLGNYHESTTVTLLTDGTTTSKPPRNTVDIYDSITNTCKKTTSNLLTDCRWFKMH
jgi:hypothetical protein